MASTGILKSRPRVRVRVPNEIAPGESFRATVLLDYPDLHLSLEVEPARGVRALLGGGVRVGNGDWDREHYVVARDADQVVPLLRRLAPLTEGAELERLDDTRLTIALRNGGHRTGDFGRFVAGARRLAEELEAARSDLPPPPAMVPARPAWEALASRMNGELETARMRVAGRIAMMDAEARITFDDEGQPAHTWLSVVPLSPLDDEHSTRWTPGAPAPYSGEASTIAASLDDVAELSVEHGRVAARYAGRLGMPGGPDTAQAERAFGRLARLVHTLRGDAGPYR